MLAPMAQSGHSLSAQETGSESAEAIARLGEDGELEIFLGDYSVGFEVGTDEQGVYITLCSDCVGEAVGVALSGEEERVPSHKELH